jgi:hypothetical protein
MAGTAAGLVPVENDQVEIPLPSSLLIRLLDPAAAATGSRRRALMLSSLNASVLRIGASNLTTAHHKTLRWRARGALRCCTSGKRDSFAPM